MRIFGEDIPWRDYFLYVYYWEKNFPQSPTVFSLRGDRYKYITYYGLWDTAEAAPSPLRERNSTTYKWIPKTAHNLFHKPEYQQIATDMEDAHRALHRRS